MNMLNDKRTACVGTTMDTQLLRINKGIILFQHLFGVLNNHWNSFDLDDFFKIANVTDEKNIAFKMGKLEKIPFMSATTSGFIEKVASFSKVITFEPNEPIILEDIDNLDIFWISTGTCRCVKLVPFVRKRVRVGYDKTKLHIRAFDQNEVLSPEDEKYNEMLQLRNLELGDHFPDIPASLTDAYNKGREGSFDKEMYLQYMNKLDTTKTENRAFMSVIATTKVEVLAIPVHDFCKYLEASMLLRLLTDESVLRVTIKEIQDSHLNNIKWTNYRKSFVASIVKEHSK